MGPVGCVPEALKQGSAMLRYVFRKITGCDVEHGQQKVSEAALAAVQVSSGGNSSKVVAEVMEKRT